MTTTVATKNATTEAPTQEPTKAAAKIAEDGTLDPYPSPRAIESWTADVGEETSETVQRWERQGFPKGGRKQQDVELGGYTGEVIPGGIL